MAMIGLVFSGDIVFDGLVQGLVYALVAFGLLLIYRATGVINFAHGQIGAFGGYLMAVLQIRYDVAFGVSLPIALFAGLVLGIVSELILRPCRHASLPLPRRPPGQCRTLPDCQCVV